MKFQVLILLAAGAFAQDISSEAKTVLDRARANVLNTTRRLPKYMCLETIERTYLRRRQPLFPKAGSCPVFIGKENPDARVTATDRVRLDVAVAEGGEIDSWPQASSFDTRNIDEIVTTGPTSTGAFGINLMQVFENQGTKFRLNGVETSNGRRIFVFEYSVPLETSHYMVKRMSGSRVKIAYSGDFTVVADTAELTRLTIETGLLPSNAGMCRALTINTYHHVKVGDGEFLIPLQSVLRTARDDGSATESVTTFSGCHEYGAESTIRFDSDDSSEPGSAASADAKPPGPLPWGADVTIKLETPVDSDTAAAGDLVWARTAAPIRKPKSKAILVPAGTRIRGRIMEVTHYLESDRGFDIAMVFDRYQLGGMTVPFAAILKPGKTRLAGSEVVLQAIEGGGKLTIHTKAAKTVVPQGFESKWMVATPPKTRS